MKLSRRTLFSQLSALALGATTIPRPRNFQFQPPLRLLSPRTFTNRGGMAWRSSGGSHVELINNLKDNGYLSNKDMMDAFLAVDRAQYAPHNPYDDAPQVIGYGATISAPHMHATAVEYLGPFLLPPTEAGAKPRRILDVGSGSGYLCHVMAEMAGEGSLVVGIEHVKELADLGRDNMAKTSKGRELLDSGRVKFVVGDGREGWKEPGNEDEGWDVIHVGAAAHDWHPQLLEQMKSPSRMFIPVDDPHGTYQDCWMVEKFKDGTIHKNKICGVRYVPLTDPRTQLLGGYT